MLNPFLLFAKLYLLRETQWSVKSKMTASYAKMTTFLSTGLKINSFYYDIAFIE